MSGWTSSISTRLSSNLSTKDIDANFDSATNAALRLAAQKDAADLPGYTGKSHAIEHITLIANGVREENRLLGNRSSAH